MEWREIDVLLLSGRVAHASLKTAVHTLQGNVTLQIFDCLPHPGLLFTQPIINHKPHVVRSQVGLLAIKIHIH